MFYTVELHIYDMSDPTCSPSQYGVTEYFKSLTDAHAFINMIDNSPSDDDVIRDALLGEPVDVIPPHDRYRYPKWSPVRYIEFITP